MKYAVIKSGGKQYRVCEGDIIEVDRLSFAKGEKASFSEVLLWVNDGEIKIGTPQVLGTKVTGKVIDQLKGKKIRVAKFKAKAKYRRVMGFRPSLTRVQITKIEASKPKKAS